MKNNMILLTTILMLFLSLGCMVAGQYGEPNDVVEGPYGVTIPYDDLWVVPYSVDELCRITDSNVVYTDRILHLSFEFPDANNVEEALLEFRQIYNFSDDAKVIDLEVQIGDEVRTASFEELFRWMGFK